MLAKSFRVRCKAACEKAFALNKQIYGEYNAMQESNPERFSWFRKARSLTAVGETENAPDNERSSAPQIGAYSFKTFNIDFWPPCAYTHRHTETHTQKRFYCTQPMQTWFVWVFVSLP